MWNLLSASQRIKCSLLKIPCLKGTPPVCCSQLLVWERDIFLICTLTNVVIFQAVLITDMPHCLLTVKQRSLWRKVAYRKYGLVCSILVAGAPLSTFIRKLCILYKGRQKSETASLPEQQPTHQTRKFIARSRFGRILSKEGILMVVMTDFCKEFHFYLFQMQNMSAFSRPFVVGCVTHNITLLSFSKIFSRAPG